MLRRNLTWTYLRPSLTAFETVGTGQKFMYVAADEALVFRVSGLLTRRGWVVSTFTKPKPPFKALRADPEQANLPITEFQLESCSGVALIRDVAALRPYLPMPPASVYLAHETRFDALAARANALNHKPKNIKALFDTVQSFLGENHGQH